MPRWQGVGGADTLQARMLLLLLPHLLSAAIGELLQAAGARLRQLGLKASSTLTGMLELG